MKRKSKFRIPGLSFSWKRAVGISGVKTRIARKTGIPLTRGGLARKIGETFLRLFMVFAVSLVITPTFADRRYYCANCGREYNSIRDLTVNSCHRHPLGSNKGKHKESVRENVKRDTLSEVKDEIVNRKESGIVEVEVDNEGANFTQVFMVVPFDAVGK
jgi:hypothetical protein